MKFLIMIKNTIYLSFIKLIKIKQNLNKFKFEKKFIFLNKLSIFENFRILLLIYYLHFLIDIITLL